MLLFFDQRVVERQHDVAGPHARARGGAARGIHHQAQRKPGRAFLVRAQRVRDEAEAVRKDDEEMDRLRRSTFAELFGSEWTAGVEAAVDLALLGRYYERIADHAVAVAGRVVFVVTGEAPIAS